MRETPRARADRPIGRGFGGERIGERVRKAHRIVRFGKPTGARRLQLAGRINF